ncbi:MAG TPA: HAMP domain-containing sensor histidine kinase [Solirubrobacteraceae bacterium]|nr:HAMP domain-containing sensor histidine kinase [Solirubrobacteraceae bacterium]
MKPAESLGSFTRYAARVTSSAYRSVPIRWRLAGGSAALTFVILCGFAGIVGVLTSRQVRGQFNDEVRAQADALTQRLNLHWSGQALNCDQIVISDYAYDNHAQIRIFDDSGTLRCSQSRVVFGTTTPAGPQFPFPSRPDERGYRVETRAIGVNPAGEVTLLYARPLSDVNHTLAKVRFFLFVGVLGGSILALLAGLAIARRAMRPIVELSDVAREIERTRDPRRQLPSPEAEDEIAVLARTLEGMLHALDAARGETEAMLERQREFVADASHELRTPLTSVLANLDLLAEELDGEQAETAEAALRSTRRMRRLVADLLLLARADANRVAPRRPTDLAKVLVEAVAELEPVAEGHEVSIHAEPVTVNGAADELHRLVLNLVENALRHTPPGTQVRASTGIRDGDAVLVVEDDGPGIPSDLQQRIFERFVRGGRDGGRGSGLGLAIVRAVAESHGGTVSIEPSGGLHGTRFVIRLPVATPAETPAPIA